ncbi:MAG: tRNA (adenosine(37)-N6)-dimethylallyltransferase MiaA [Deltaproteobacteria bacterium]|nr:tRNA (adenosine(37)-N6)-dimethylallyltransferase MiaA [Deltaproteobacteria bacterium]
MSEKKLVAIVGPTGSGKTGLALELAPRLDGEIVCLDSAQVYSGLDIGTAKPTKAERSMVPHHLFDVIDPEEHMDAAKYVKMADRVLADISRRKKKPFLVGGTGLWLRSLVHGLFEAPPIDSALRARLDAELCRSGVDVMHDRLAKVDPVSAARIGSGDRQRVLRALEYYYQTGEPISRAQSRHEFKSKRYECLTYFLDRPRDELKERLKERLESMLRDGWVEEVEKLLASGVPRDAQAFKAHGYRHIIKVVNGKLALEEARELILREHWAYTKRSRTWYKKVAGIRKLVPPLKVDEIFDEIEAFFN